MRGNHILVPRHTVPNYRVRNISKFYFRSVEYSNKIRYSLSLTSQFLK